jgi:hypothetical protein
MKCRTSNWLAMACWSGLILLPAGCSRSAVVSVPETTPPVEESAAPSRAREQSDEAEHSAPLFPDDAGGRLLAKVLPPREPDNLRLPDRDTQGSVPVSMHMNPPDLPLPRSQAELPHLSVPARTAPLRPQLVLDEALTDWPEPLTLPQQQSLPDAGRVRVSSEDVNQPLPLPILAQPVPDRASLDDATADASTAAALAAPLPARTTPAPFLRLTLPDPYDHRRNRVLTPEESLDFPLGRPQPPRR